MKQIIAMGGGGFSMEPENPLLDLYILQQSSSNNPKVCFVPTASGDADGYIQRRRWGRNSLSGSEHTSSDQFQTACKSLPRRIQKRSHHGTRASSHVFR